MLAKLKGHHLQMDEKTWSQSPCCIHSSPAQTLQVILAIDLRLDVRIACYGLQHKFQHAEYFT